MDLDQSNLHPRIFFLLFESLYQKAQKSPGNVDGIEVAGLVDGMVTLLNYRGSIFELFHMAFLPDSLSLERFICKLQIAVIAVIAVNF